jgi:hypothetical protein
MLPMPRIVRPDPRVFVLGIRVPRWTGHSPEPLSETKNHRNI